MSDSVIYEDFGEVYRETPLEAFYEAMRPLLENYGVSAEFPSDKPSLAYSINGIEHNVLIGELPNAVRYLKWQESPYANGGFELTLESETLVHRKTGEKLAFKIFISDYISGMTHHAGNFCLTLKISGEKTEVEALQKAITPVLNKYNFQSHKAKNEQIKAENLDSEIMTNDVNFDELARKAFSPDWTNDDQKNLYTALISLPGWHFIAVGEFPNAAPFYAVFPGYLDNLPLVAVFTDGERLRRYAAKNDVKNGAGYEPFVIPTDDGFIEFSSDKSSFSFAPKFFFKLIDKIFNHGIRGIIFNHGEGAPFFVELQQFRSIYEYLIQENTRAKDGEILKMPSAATEKEIAENRVDFDALSRKAENTDASNDWREVYAALFALPEWLFIERGNIVNSRPYIASNAAIADNQAMIRAFTDSKRLHRFAQENNLTSEDGSVDLIAIQTENAVSYLEHFIKQGIYGVWFNSDSESDGFYISLKQIRPIKERLEKENLERLNNLPIEKNYGQQEISTNAEIKYRIIFINAILGFWRKAEFDNADARTYFLCVPAEWTAEENFKEEYTDKFFCQLVGQNWDKSFSRMAEGNIGAYSSKILTNDLVKAIKWDEFQDNRRFCEFYIAFASGEIKRVDGEKFQLHIEMQAARRPALPSEI